MSDLNDLSKPTLTDTEPDVLDTLRGHLVRVATWAGWGGTSNKVSGLMSATTAAVNGGRSMRLFRRNDANTADEEVVSLPGIGVDSSIHLTGAGVGSINTSALGSGQPTTAKVLHADRVWRAAQFSQRSLFVSSGSWVVPEGVSQARVTVIGAGGAGGGSISENSAGSGGGGGGAATKTVTNLVAGDSISVTVGAGGVESGGTSSFGSYCSATGGSPGSYRTDGGWSNGGLGGLGSGGDLNIAGHVGQAGSVNASISGAGGGSLMGGGGPGKTSPSGALNAGRSYGGGGGGGFKNASGYMAAGHGAGGVVVVEY